MEVESSGKNVELDEDGDGEEEGRNGSARVEGPPMYENDQDDEDQVDDEDDDSDDNEW